MAACRRGQEGGRHNVETAEVETAEMGHFETGEL
jgi:hypothetical protein